MIGSGTSSCMRRACSMASASWSAMPAPGRIGRRGARRRHPLAELPGDQVDGALGGAARGGVLGADDRERAVGAVGLRDRGSRDSGSSAAPRSAAATAGTQPRWTSVTSARGELQCGKRVVRLLDETPRPRRRSTPSPVGVVTACADWLVPTIARPRQGTSVSIRPSGPGAASAMSAARFVVTRFIAFTQRERSRHSQHPGDAASRRARGVDDHARADRRPRRRSASRGRASRSTRLPDWIADDRLDIVGELGPGAIRRRARTQTSGGRSRPSDSRTTARRRSAPAGGRRERA